VFIAHRGLICPSSPAGGGNPSVEGKEWLCSACAGTVGDWCDSPGFCCEPSSSCPCSRCPLRVRPQLVLLVPRGPSLVPNGPLSSRKCSALPRRSCVWWFREAAPLPCPSLIKGNAGRVLALV